MVTILLIMNVEKLIGSNQKGPIMTNVDDINKYGGLKMSEDNNTFKLIWKRVRQNGLKQPWFVFSEIMNILINISMIIFVNL